MTDGFVLPSPPHAFRAASCAQDIRAMLMEAWDTPALAGQCSEESETCDMLW